MATMVVGIVADQAVAQEHAPDHVGRARVLNKGYGDAVAIIATIVVMVVMVVVSVVAMVMLHSIGRSGPGNQNRRHAECESTGHKCQK
jgi:hypothetical protein